MESLEDQLRASLQTVAATPLPISLSPEAIIPHAQQRPRRHWGRWVVLAVVAALGIGGGSVVSSARPAASAVVDVGADTANPVIGLDTAVVRQLYAMVSDQLAASEQQPAEPAQRTEGFGGFIVTSTDPADVQLQLMPDGAYFHHDGALVRLTSRSFYQLLWRAITPQLDTQTRAKLPPANPNTPTTITASIPPEVGDPKVWQVDGKSHVTPTSTSLTIRVIVSKGTPADQILPPVVSYGSDDIVIRTAADPQHGAHSDVASLAKVVVQLTEPVGNRRLIDAACLSAPFMTGPRCEDGGIRWQP